MLDGFVDLIDHRGIVGEVAVGEPACAAMFVHLVGDLADARGEGFELGGGDGVFFVDGVGGGVFPVVFDLVHSLPRLRAA
jgi:hypothetical protein